MKNILLSLTLLLSLSVFAMPSIVSADSATKTQIQCGANAAAGQDCNTPSATPADANSLISKIINILSGFVGAVAVIMIMVGGFRYVTSAGSETGVAGAKKTITYALVGLVIVALAQIIVHFVINNVTDSSAQTGKCKASPYGRYWVGGPNDGKAC